MGAHTLWLVSVVLAACAADTRQPEAIEHVEVRVVAHDTSWSATYQPGDLPTDREVHVPVGADVSLALASRDFVAFFSMPELGLRDFASPDLPGSLHVHADHAGSYELRGDELCGLPHGERTRGHLVVEERDAFESWLRSRRAGSR
jgi:cytochrome c oxidase subunit II